MKRELRWFLPLIIVCLIAIVGLFSYPHLTRAISQYVDRPQFTEEEVKPIISYNLPNFMPSDYQPESWETILYIGQQGRCEFPVSRMTATYSGKGKWSFIGYGETWSSRKWRLDDYKPQTTTRYTLRVTGAYFEKTNMIEVITVER